MDFNDIKLIKHSDTSARQFGYWIHFRDRRDKSTSSGRKGRRDLIKFVESKIGPIGSRWQYQKLEQNDYILKLNSQQDFLIFLLRLG